MEKFIDLVRKLFGIEPSVEKITNPINKIYVKLDKLADAETRKAAAEEDRAARLHANAANRCEKAAAARAWEPIRRAS